jgi:secreted protein with Ig-like and vWFA domain
MNVNKEDPRITAFALGELDDDERDAVETAVAADPELQELVKEVGVAANLAGLALRQANAPGLSDAQRQAILDASEQVTRPRINRRRGGWRMGRFIAMAVCVVLGLGAYVMWLMAGEPLGESIQTTKRMEGDIVLFAPAQPADASAESELTEELHSLGYSDGWASTHKRPSDLDAQAPAGQAAGASRVRGSSLRNVQVGGEIRVRENYYAESLEDPSFGSTEANRPELVAGVPEATSEPEGAKNVDVYQSYIESEVMAPLQSQPAEPPAIERNASRRMLSVSAGIDPASGIPSISSREPRGREYSIDFWGEDFRSDYVPDADNLAASQLGLGMNEQQDPVLMYEINPLRDQAAKGVTGGGFGGGGGNFGGGGFGGGGQSSDQFSTSLENGAIRDRSHVIQNYADTSVADDKESLKLARTQQLMQEGQENLDRLDYEKAQQYYEQVLLIDPGNETATRRLAESTVGAYNEESRGSSRRRGRTDDDDYGFRRGEERVRTSYLYAIRRVPGTESYAPIPVKPFTSVAQEPLSTFSVDVDTASYANVRRFLTQGQVPPPDAVRVEEMINYFDYEYAPPRGEDPISVDVEIAQCVWETQHRLARIALKAREVPMDDRGPANLVFLIDVSGSMKDANKLPLLKESMKALTRQLQPQDRVAIVTYRDAASIALSPTTVGDRITVETAINGLHADGSTNGAGGLDLAYSVASQNVIRGGINRVILATDGDFNVGETDNERLVELIRNSAATGVFLTVLGFGEGNLKDDRLEAMADKGNGAYHYIDNYNEATRVLCAQVGATLATVAKDVKIQVEFNPQHVSAYRLIGYENRALAAADFNNDRKDAGEMGSGEAVTALYEIVPVDRTASSGDSALKQKDLRESYEELGRTVESAQELEAELGVEENVSEKLEGIRRKIGKLLKPDGNFHPETMTVKVRYKEPEGDASRKFEVPVVDRGQGYDQSSRDYRWALAVAGFGSLLRHPPMQHATWSNDDGTEIFTAAFPGGLGTLTLAQVREIAEGANGYDPDGRRAEFLSLVVAAQTLTGL